MHRTKWLSRRRIIITAFICIIGVWILVPFFFLIVTSIAPHGMPVFGLTLPKEVTLEGYKSVLRGGDGQPTVWLYMFNSVVIAAGGTIAAFLVAVPGAYGLSRLMPSGRARFVYLSFLALHALPTVALVLAIFLIYSKYGLIDSRIWLTVALLAISVPFEVWILKSFFDAVPRDLEDAAALDGAGQVKTLVRVVLPMMGEPIAATGVLTFLTLYIDFIFAVTLTSRNAVTIPVYVLGFQNETAVNITATSAAAVVSMLPMLGVYLVAQRYMTRTSLIGG